MLKVRSNTLQQVKKFKYLGVVFTSGGKQSKEFDIWIVKANTVLLELYCSVVTNQELSTRTVARKSSIGGL